MSVKILLLQPYGTTRNFTRSQSVYPPLGLCQIAAMFPKEDAYVLDAEGLDLTDEETKEEILKRNPKILGLTATSFTLDMVEKWASWAKKNSIKVLVGGPHGSAEPQNLFETCPSADYLVRGEPEEVIVKITDDIINGNVADNPDICYRKNDGFIISKGILRVSDLSKIPMPRFDSLPIKNYHCPDAERSPMMTLQLSRGCPNNCSFCSSTYLEGRKIRYYSTKSIIDQLEHLSKDLGVKEISFVDDGFTTNKKMAMEICHAIIDKKLDITWFCNARADMLSEDLVAIMKKAGCHQVYIGCESGNDQMLKAINKHLTKTQLIKGSDMLHKYDINISAGFIVGLPGDKWEYVAESIDLVKRIKPYRVQFSHFISLPGSDLYKMIGKNGTSFHNQNGDQYDEWIENAYEQAKEYVSDYKKVI
jgi:radical SAM superfamily enzyme YgiQ (UPF0313 family)